MYVHFYSAIAKYEQMIIVSSVFSILRSQIPVKFIQKFQALGTYFYLSISVFLYKFLIVCPSFCMHIGLSDCQSVNCQFVCFSFHNCKLLRSYRQFVLVLCEPWYIIFRQSIRRPCPLSCTARSCLTTENRTGKKKTDFKSILNKPRLKMYRIKIVRSISGSGWSDQIRIPI